MKAKANQIKDIIFTTSELTSVNYAIKTKDKYVIVTKINGVLYRVVNTKCDGFTSTLKKLKNQGVYKILGHIATQDEVYKYSQI